MKDLARIYVKAGDGGTGSMHFRHERYAPLGGPDGGDGGKGGDVILVADENIETLVEFNFKKKFEAKNGEAGMGKKMHGVDRPNLRVPVPVGTVVYELPEELATANLRKRDELELVISKAKLAVDLIKHGQEFVMAFGGRGGKGNWHFRSSTNQAPKEFEPGHPGEAKWLMLELKVVAHVGIIGLPNVGKSSLLKTLTRANPKIAGYPFTTLEPNLGVMAVNGGQPTANGEQHPVNSEKRNNLILVDVPGVVEEAWEGKGIGPWFLRHLERSRMLVHVLAVDVTRNTNTRGTVEEQLIGDYMIVRKELEKYGKGLPEKEEIVVVNKRELVESKERVKIAKEFTKKTGKDLTWVSAGMGEVGELVRILQGVSVECFLKNMERRKYEEGGGNYYKTK